MRLDDWLEKQGISASRFAAEIGVTHVTVSRWSRGVRMPRPAMMRRIGEATGGAVTANDFHSPQDGAAAAAAPVEAGREFDADEDSSPRRQGTKEDTRNPPWCLGALVVTLP